MGLGSERKMEGVVRTLGDPLCVGRPHGRKERKIRALFRGLDAEGKSG